MADDPKPVEVRSPGYSYDRTNDIRINRDTAERIIARYLRDDSKMLPANANELAARITSGLYANMSAPTRTAMRGSRMIPQYPSEQTAAQVARAVRALPREEQSDWAIGRDVWRIVYEHGHAIPDDLVA